jgi:glycerol kinase
MAYILALDQGTTSSFAIPFDQESKVAGIAQHEFKQIFPETGWVEHDPFDILTTQFRPAVEVMGKLRGRPRDVAAFGITNQCETTLVWERETGKPIYNAIVWQDRRTAPLCEKLRNNGAEDSTRQKTGLLVLEASR